MSCLQTAGWAWAFYCTMFGAGLLSVGSIAIIVCRALYIDVRRLLSKRRWQQRRAMIRVVRS